MSDQFPTVDVPSGGTVGAAKEGLLFSRRRAIAIAFGAIACSTATACLGHDKRAASIDSDASRRRSPVTVSSEHYDVRRSGARCDGASDDTAAWQDAVRRVSNAGGGKIWWRGTTVATQIELAGSVGLLGLGPEISVIIQKTGRRSGQHMILLQEPDARNVTLQDFAINGNRAAQQGSANAVHFDNAQGDGVLARHLVRNLHISNVAGSGLFWGYQMRSSLVDGVTIYYCDDYGVHASVFSDNTMQNVDVGQAGLHGFYLASCYNSKFSNLKSWYSGRLKPNSAGIYQRNGSINVYSNILTQENSGTGMIIYGATAPIRGVIVRALNSDSDNAAGSESHHGLSLNNVQDSIFDLTVTSEAPRKARPYAGVALTNSGGNKINANIDESAVTWKLIGTSVGSNDIDLGRGIYHAPPESPIISPSVYVHRTTQIELRGDLAVINPQTPVKQPPVGLRYSFALIQDGKGGHRVNWSSAYKLPAAAVLDTSANTRTNIEFECAGESNWTMTEFATGVPI